MYNAQLYSIIVGTYITQTAGILIIMDISNFSISQVLEFVMNKILEYEDDVFYFDASLLQEIYQGTV